MCIGLTPTSAFSIRFILEAREQEVEALRELVNDQVAPWQQISGIPAKGEHFENPNRRAAGLRKLLSGIERLLRYELNRAPAVEEIPAEEKECEWLDRSFQWDPLRLICLQYQIAQRKLSGFSKELTGMSAIELVDGIRAEKVRAALKAELKRFIVSRESERQKSTTEDIAVTEGTGKEWQALADEVFAALKASRRGPRFHRATWAAGLGFSSYQKFFRACLHCYGLTPHQLEIAMIEEILGESADSGSTERDVHAEARNITAASQETETEILNGGEQPVKRE